MITRSERNVHVGLHVSINVRKALGDEAKKREISISLLIATIIERELISLGYDIYAKPKSANEVSLPFEDPET